MAHLPLKALRVFETVARCGSFKEAASELCVSQSAISHQVRHLEEWLDRPLFDRTGQRPKLLAHGEMLARSVQRSLQDMDTACKLASGSKEPNALVIAAIPSVAICWLIPRLASFQASNPEIATRLIYAIHGQHIDFNEVDLAFVFASGPPDFPGVTTRIFQPGTSVPVCSPALRDTMDTHAMPEAILRAGLLHDSNVSNWIDWFGKAGLEPLPPIAGPLFEDFNLLRASALAGQGVALCPLALIHPDLASGRLVQLSSMSINEDRSYYLIHRDTDDHSAISARERFIAWVFAALHEEIVMHAESAASLIQSQ